MTMQMYDPSVQWAVLRLLDRWERLPYSDLLALLPPMEMLRLRDTLLRDMEWEGLVTIRRSGDEEVVSITERGRERLQRRQQPPTH